MARLAVAAVAGVIAGYFLGPVAGFQTFAFVYGVTGFLDPNAKQLGPKLSDLTAPKADFGAPVAFIIGTTRVAGNVIYSTTKMEVATTLTQDGKGGPGVDSTTYTYKINLLIEVAANQLADVRRAFANGKLRWTQANGATIESLVASSETNAFEDIRFYDGNPTQLPDPDYEADVGVGNAPAYRHRSTIFLKGLNLGNSGQLPLMTFEVCEDTAIYPNAYDLFTAPYAADGYPYGVGSSNFNPVGFNLHVRRAPEDVHTDVYYIDSLGAVKLIDNYNAPFSNPASHGTSDIDGLMTVGGKVGRYNWTQGQRGQLFKYEIPYADVRSVGNEGARYVVRGNTVVIGGTDAYLGLCTLHRFRKVDGAPGPAVPIVSRTFGSGEGLDWIAINSAEDTVWVLDRNNHKVRQFDALTLTLQTTFDTPASSIGCGLLVSDEDDVLWCGSESPADISTWDGTAWTVKLAGASINIGSPGNSLYNVNGGVPFALKLNPFDPHIKMIAYYTTIAPVDEDLDDVMIELSTRTGQLTEAQLDFSALAPQKVHGMGVTQVAATRSTVEMLSSAFYFDSVEVGELIVGVPRGAAAVRTIPIQELGLSSDGSEEAFPRHKLNDVEYPKSVIVKFSNKLLDYQPGAEEGNRLVTPSTSSQVIEFPIVMTPSEAKKLADIITTDIQTGLVTIGPLKLGTKHLDLMPSNVVIFTDRQGNALRTRILQIDITDFMPSVTLAVDDATAINSLAATDSSYESQTLVSLEGPTTEELIDTAILRDQDNGPGFYAQPYAKAPWPGASIEKSLDGTNYSLVRKVTQKAVGGSALTTLGTWTGGNVFDELNRLTVNVGDGQLFSTTRDVMLTTNANALAVGTRATGWEIVQFRSATMISAGVYMLSGFLRGLKGTEWRMGTHATNERVALLEDGGGTYRVEDSLADLGVAYSWKATTFNKNRSLSDTIVFANTEVGMKPYAPVDLQFDTVGVQDLRLRFNRRSRLSSVIFADTVPLGETSERYEVDVLQGTSLKRTLMSNAPSVTYTRAMQAQDGVTSTDLLTFKACQMSASIGRGYLGVASTNALRAPVGQVTTLTLGGTFEARNVTVTFSALTDSTGAPLAVVQLTVLAATSLTNAATQIKNAINANSSLTGQAGVSTTSAGAVVTIGGSFYRGFIVTAATDEVHPIPIPSSVDQVAAPASAPRSEKISINIISSLITGFRSISGYTYTLRLLRGADGRRSRIEYRLTETPDTAGATAAQLLWRLVGVTPTIVDNMLYVVVRPTGVFFNPAYGYDNGPRAEFPAGETDWSVDGFSSDSTATFIGTYVDYGAPNYPFDQAQVVTFGLGLNYASPTVGDKYRLKLAGANYDYTVASGNTYTNVIAGLKTAVEAGGLYTARDSTGSGVYYQITVTAATANLPFTFDTYLNPSTMSFAVVNTQEAA